VDVPYVVLEAWASVNIVLLLLLAGSLLTYAHRARSLVVKRISNTAAIFATLTAFAASLRIVSLARFQRSGSQFWGSAIEWSMFVLVAAATSGVVIWSLARLRQTLRLVERDERMVSVLTEQARVDTTVSEWGLTARELQVVEAIASGVVSDREIADALFIAPTTVATHVHHILQKAGLSSRLDVMLYADDSAVRTGGSR
jgi:DNA-binding CsgD family transcriptional regulator